MALFGQVSAQVPQSRQAPASIWYWVSPWEIAPTGQASAHAPQLTQAELIAYAIWYAPPIDDTPILA